MRSKSSALSRTACIVVEEVAHRVVLEVRGTKGDRDGRDVTAGDVGVARRERRHVVAASYELDDQLVHDPLSAAVALGRDALERWGDLGNAKWAIHRRVLRIRRV